MRALVTGGTGFIGANLVAGLVERGVAARVLMRPTSSQEALHDLTYETVVGDVLDEPEELARSMEGCDWVFHAAAVADYWRRGKDLLYRVNVEGTRRMLAAARLARVGRFVFTSSLAAMGLADDGELLNEAHVFNLSPAQFPYGHSKHLAEQAVRDAVERGLEAVIVNPSVVLGPRDVNLISGSLVLEAARGRLRFSPPGGTNFVAVDDVVAGHVAAAEVGRVGQRYILAGCNRSHAEMMGLICDVVGCRPPAFKIPRWLLPSAALAVQAARALWGNRVPVDENQVRLMGANIYADRSKAKRELDLPQTPLRGTVRRTFNWYNEHGYLEP
jgi:dihydroflavonol-4-reductase